MGELTIPIIGGDQVLDNADYADAIPINMLAVIRDIKGNPGYLISHDGLTQTHTGQGIDRGLYSMSAGADRLGYLAKN